MENFCKQFTLKRPWESDYTEINTDDQFQKETNWSHDRTIMSYLFHDSNKSSLDISLLLDVKSYYMQIFVHQRFSLMRFVHVEVVRKAQL